MATRIYNYGAREPVEGLADVLRVQHQAGHLFRNALVAAARRLDDVTAAVVRAACPPEIVAAANRASFFAAGWARAASALRSGGRTGRGQGRSPVADRVERARERERAAHRALWSEERAARRREDVRAQLADLRAAHAAAGRDLRADDRFGGPGTWTSRGLSEAAHKSALDAVGKRRFGKDGRPADPTARPSFHGERDSVRVGGQPGTEGVTVAEALACNHSFLRIAVAPEAHRGGRRAGARKALAWLRIDSAGRLPVWAKVPIVMHRPLPEGGKIATAWLLRRYVGQRVEWSMQFTVSYEEAPEALPGEPSTVALNLGWRRLPDGAIRVGYAVGSDGREREIRVPGDTEQVMQHVASLASIRSTAQDAMTARVLAFARGETAPEALRRAVVGLDRARSPERLHDFSRRWGSVPAGEEGALVEALRGWSKQDRHLGFWEADERAKCLRRRAQQPAHAGAPGYRVVAAELARQFDRCVVTDMDMREMAEAMAPEDGGAREGSAQRRQRMIAAPSDLARFVREAFERKGPSRFVEAKAIDFTRACPSCGVVEEDGRVFAAGVMVTCSACGEARDQDAAHCRRLLGKVASGEVVFEDGMALAPSVTEESGGAKAGGGGRWRRGRSQRAAEVPAAQGAAG